MTHALLPYSRGRRVSPEGSAPVLDVRSATVSYAGAESPALDGVDLRVAAGGRVALVGPNGSGKSTLLKTVAGLLPLAGGSVRVHGLPPAACRPLVAYLPQRGDVDWRFPVNVRRLVMTGRYAHLGWLRWPGRQDRAIVDDALAKLGLTDLAERQIGRLSGGQQQRALLARALAQRADLLLLDEPLNAVDAITRAAILALLDELHRGGVTMVMATHDIDRLIGEFDFVLRLSEGRVASIDEIAGLRREDRATAWAG